MKKILSAAAAMILAANTACFAAAPGGTEVTYYDVSAYINNYPIPCYNINDYCGIYVRDLASYGFKIDYNEEKATVNITRDKSVTEISGIENVALPYQRKGTVHGVSGNSNIRVMLDGVETESYWLDGSMMILLDKVAVFGNFGWDDEKRALFVTIPGLSETEYVPLERAKRIYTREKHSSWDLSATDYTVYPDAERHWGFVRVKGDEPRMSDWEKTQLENYGGFYIDHTRPHAIYLTFDEGYENGYTPQIMDVLTKYDVPATFFVTGQFLDERPDLVQEMIDRGFSIGNHTVNHPNLAKCSTERIMSELERVSDRLQNDFGYTTYYMRPPEGAFSERVLAVARDMGYNTILWSYAYMDYDVHNQPGETKAYNMITEYMHDGAIYLLHAVSKDNANVLERVIQYAIANGYEFKSLDDLCQP